MFLSEAAMSEVTLVKTLVPDKETPVDGERLVITLKDFQLALGGSQKKKEPPGIRIEVSLSDGEKVESWSYVGSELEIMTRSEDEVPRVEA
jgi:hypothetical protein